MPTAPPLPPLNLALRIAIAASGRRQKDIARQAGMNQWRLSRIVHCDATATPAEQVRLGRTLRQPVHTLFPAEVTP